MAWYRVALALVALFTVASPAAAEYTGPIIDAHSHLPNAAAIEAYVAAMQRHNVVKVVLLGVGGVQKKDAAWIAAAARKHPDRVVVGAPVPDPTAADAASALDRDIERLKARAAGEVHVRQVSRKINRSPADPVFLEILGVVAKHGVPIVIHQELNEAASAALEQALAAERRARIVLAHAGGSAPDRIERLLTRHPNLMVDLSGMHFERKPALAPEHGPLYPDWKAVIEKMPDRFLMGIDVWATRLFAPAMLDRLMTWTRRVLGELRPDVAERVAYTNAVELFGLK